MNVSSPRPNTERCRSWTASSKIDWNGREPAIESTAVRIVGAKPTRSGSDSITCSVTRAEMIERMWLERSAAVARCENCVELVSTCPL